MPSTATGEHLDRVRQRLIMTHESIERDIPTTT
jgi:hypothetical protein